MFEIRICPESPNELEAVLQLVQALAGARQEAGAIQPLSNLPAEHRDTADPGKAPLAETPAPDERPAEAVKIVASDIPGPPSGEPDRTYSPEQVFEALQEFARLHGAAALKGVLDRVKARKVSDIQPADFGRVMTIARGEEA